VIGGRGYAEDASLALQTRRGFAGAAKFIKHLDDAPYQPPCISCPIALNEALTAFGHLTCGRRQRSNLELLWWMFHKARVSARGSSSL